MPPYDVKRDLKRCYAPTNSEWALVDVPAQRFIAVDGRGDPNTDASYTRAVEALYSVAYTLKFTGRRALDRDFVVGPLEGLWWADTPEAFTTRAKHTWHWRMLISRPDWITEELVEDARRAALEKKSLPTIGDVRSVSLNEGTSAQCLHIGPYDDEGPALAELHGEYLAAHDLRITGLHHEIYLSDPRRTDPARLRTILRQPVRRTG
ncbi:GyrI-like domain-containing protein [Streptomyces sp. bgisy091]|uniref:GyrI-like domain-containing protein n=1 Tax=Streptomyces sp. bgisy091 TaxID=3413778 RepID=UPI003D74521D